MSLPQFIKETLKLCDIKFIFSFNNLYVSFYSTYILTFTRVFLTKDG